MIKGACLLVAFFIAPGAPHEPADTKLVPIGKAWAKNSVNANILRRNALVSHAGNQYVAYYSEDAYVVLAKRKLGSTKWETKKTPYKGNVADGHNTISIMVDGDGYLHMAWDHHNQPLSYCRSKEPGSLELTSKMPMTGKRESRVTYPEFYRLPDGNLLFLYRDGQSGNGNLMMNHYDRNTRTWTRRQDGFIDGEGKRNAYWQMCTDSKGTIHLSWVWRETPDVATNHDMAYAKSHDGGRTWRKSTGEKYGLPITANSAEYAARIPQGSNLINTTSICADADGRPYIATYFSQKGSSIPQYHLIHRDTSGWLTSPITKRRTPFSLSGGGTKRIMMSRPQLVVRSNRSMVGAYMLFRDAERANRVSAAICDDMAKAQWRFEDLTRVSVGMWEPSYDTELWNRAKSLHIYVQEVGQGDGESTEDMPPTEVTILEWTPG